MAIEIIKRGTLPEDQRYKATCSNCRTEVALRKNDGRFSKDDTYYYTCPVCESEERFFAQEGNEYHGEPDLAEGNRG